MDQSLAGSTNSVGNSRCMMAHCCDPALQSHVGAVSMKSARGRKPNRPDVGFRPARNVHFALSAKPADENCCTYAELKVARRYAVTPAPL